MTNHYKRLLNAMYGICAFGNSLKDIMNNLVYFCEDYPEYEYFYNDLMAFYIAVIERNEKNETNI